MKDWSEYETDVEYFTGSEIRREMRREIDGLALTKDERDRLLRELPAAMSIYRRAVEFASVIETMFDGEYLLFKGEEE